ncbi:MAG: PAS domain-containing protein [Alphaproteobacteria bacterium]|jgi:PAS domain S-box-containing protein|nr:PAS domain-containing protein [Alphaproteobacteria bacterium]
MPASPSHARLQVHFRPEGTLLQAAGPLAAAAARSAAGAADGRTLVRALIDTAVGGDACEWMRRAAAEPLIAAILAGDAVCDATTITRDDGVRLLTLFAEATADGARRLTIGEMPLPAGLDASPIEGVDLLQDIVDAVPVTISIKDAERRYVFVNRSWERFYGVDRGQVLGKRFESLTPGRIVAGTFDDHSSHVESRDEQVLANGQSLADQEEYVSGIDGAERTLLSSKLPLVDADGRPRGILSVTHDITARKDQELALARAKAEAEAADRAKTEFLTVVNQETQGPLAELLAAVARARAGIGDTAGAGAGELEDIERCGRQLRRLIDDLLDLSALDLGTATLRPGPMDPRVAIEAVVAGLRMDVAAKGLTLDVRVAAEVPALVIADEIRVRQVLARLLENALRFTREGGIVVLCSVSGSHAGQGPPTAAAGQSLVFSVDDTGLGIPADRQAYIFAPFTRLDAAARSGDRGPGLGLAIAGRLVAAMGGEIGVENRDAGGSRFWFAVPVRTWQPQPGPRE